jgi:hypothetical protein
MVFYLKKYIKTELYAKKEGPEHDNSTESIEGQGTGKKPEILILH